MVEIPRHRSTGRRDGEPGADANCPSPRSPNALDDASFDSGPINVRLADDIAELFHPSLSTVFYARDDDAGNGG